MSCRPGLCASEAIGQTAGEIATAPSPATLVLNQILLAAPCKILFLRIDPLSTFRHRPICEQVSEIRFDGRRDRSVFFGTVFMRVFGTDTFRPVKEDAPIGFARGPSCCEDALILDSELELQCLALIVGVGSPSFINGTAAHILAAAKPIETADVSSASHVAGLFFQIETGTHR